MIMKKLLCAFVLSIIVGELSITSASGQTTIKDTKIDLTKVTCRSLLKMDGDDRSSMVIFLQGYMSGKKNETVIDTATLTEITDKVADYCIDNPNVSAMSAFERYRN